MSAVNSTMLELGTDAPPFKLPDTISGNIYIKEGFRGNKAFLVVFMCNHCPYVKLIKKALVDYAEDYMPKGVGMVAISSNDADKYPDDSPKDMQEDARKFGYPFPYLYDETQEVAKAYKAACTPDFFLFDENMRLVYRGQFDDARPGNDVEPDGSDLRKATDQVLAGEAVPEEQTPSIGCNIKWKPGNEPGYFG